MRLLSLSATPASCNSLASSDINELVEARRLAKVKRHFRSFVRIALSNTGQDCFCEPYSRGRNRIGVIVENSFDPRGRLIEYLTDSFRSFRTERCSVDQGALSSPNSICTRRGGHQNGGIAIAYIWSLWPLFTIGNEPDVGEGRVLMSAIPRPE